ncbi:MAG: hypothetical protein EBW57_03050 [Candidatus Fonsibacter ubiquis]|nr:hypothetical protein [Candidatus Fonsibacter ubiquis]
MFKDFTKWMSGTATVLFDDTKNDLRALPKTVRLQILIVLSALWSAYYTFKQFQDIRKFRTDPNYHTPTRSRQNLWINGKQTKLPKDDPGGEHE